jgi:hypothetical protein
MATLNLPKGFEKSLLPNDLRKGLEPFIDYVNQNVDQIVRAFINQLTFSDNFRGRVSNIQAYSNTPITLELQNTAATGVIILTATAKVRSYNLTQLSTGGSQITIVFDEAKPIKTRSVSVSSGILLNYEIEAASQTEPGTLVSISGYGNKGNNGTFLVIASTSNSLTVANNNTGAAAESKTSFTGERELPKSVSLLVLT